MAVTVSGGTSRRSSRSIASRIPKPQSMRTRVSPTSTSKALPSLPLPSDANRMNVGPLYDLLELILQQPENLVAVGGLVRGALGILDRHHAVRIGLRHDDAVLLGLLLLVALPEPELVQQALLLAGFRIRIGVTNEVQAVRTVALDHRESGAIERQADAPPGAIEGVVDDEPAGPVGALLDACPRRYRLLRG